MSELTRRRDTTRNEETWLIFLDDVHIGTIGRRAGVPTDAEQWGWRCGIPSEFFRARRDALCVRAVPACQCNGNCLRVLVDL